MPAIITHDLFGQDVYHELHASIGETRDEYEAFLLGNQGPDPLFYTVISPSLREFHQLGSTMHNVKPTELIAAFKDSLSVLAEDEAPIGRAYALGFLCHYTLDSSMHPLVFAQEYAVCDAGVDGLARDNGHEVHGTIESEFDEMALFTVRHQTIASFNPSVEILKASDFVLDAISKMYAFVAMTVYGLFIPSDMFATAVRNFRFVQGLFYSPTGSLRAVIGRVEELVRPYSFYRSMSHRPVEITESQFGNHERAVWANPFTGEESDLGFWEIFADAQEKAKSNIASFASKDFDLEAARRITGDLDFSGEPTNATLVVVDDE